MSALFISHSSRDNELARWLERRLAERNHHSVFLDLDPEKGIVGGQSWERTLYRKLRACRAVIALITDHHLASHWCFAEIALARMEGKQVIALQATPLAEEAALPAILAQDQCIDLRTRSDEGLQRLWRALAELDLPGAAGEWNPREPPYPGLSAYREKDAPVFFGRETEAQGGVELLERGAPGLVMVLGASGSGKSSLALAGMLPRLRARASRWLVVDPFRPGRDPLGELVESLARTWSRLGGTAAERGLRERLHARLDGAAAPEPPPQEPPAPRNDERLQRLVELLERVHADPPPELGARTREHLAWSLEDLQRLLDAPASPSETPAAVPTTDTSLVVLVREMVRLAPRRDARVLIVIDQFEELLGHAVGTPAGEEARRFLRLLREALDGDAGLVMVLATMRSDFLGLFQRDPALAGIDFASLSLGPMRVDGMRRVIEAPAQLAAIELERGLVERLLEDTATADALPLLSFTLSVLYRDRSDTGRITLADYERAGGLQGTVGREADAVLESAARAGQAEALRVAMLQMVRLREDGGHARVAVEWSRPEIQRAKAVLDKLVERRVLVSRAQGETPVVEVAHEALFRTWTPLRAWIENARADLLLRQQLERDATTWVSSHRAPEQLWRGGRLLQAGEWLRKTAGASASAPAADFVRAGLRRRWRTRIALGATTAAIIVVLSGLLANSLRQAERARLEQARALDLARVSVAAEWLERDPTSAALALLDVGDPEGTRFAPRRLSEALHASVVASEFRHTGPVHSVAIDGTGRRVLTTTGREAVIWDASSGRRLSTIQQDEGVTDATFDPTGRMVLLRAGEIGEHFHGDHEGRRAWVHDAATGRRLLAIDAGSELGFVAFGPDGKFLLVGARDGSLRLWDTTNGEPHVLAEPKSSEVLAGAAFSPDGRRLVTLAGKRAQLWDLPAAQPAATVELDLQVSTAAFSADGKRLAVGGAQGVQIVDPASGAPRGASIDHGLVRSIAFSPDGLWLLTASDHEVRLWSVEGSQPRFSAPIVHAGLRHAAFSSDGTLVVTLPGHDGRRGYGSPAHDNSLRFWDARTGQSRHVQRLLVTQELMSAAWDDEARTLVANEGGRVGSGRFETLQQRPTARLWNVALRDRREMHGQEHDHAVTGATISPDGSRLLSAAGNVVRVGERGGAQGALELRHDMRVSAAAFDDGGRVVVSASDDGTARIWNAQSGQERFVARHREPVRHAVLVANGGKLATYAGGRLRLWNVTDGQAETGAPTFELAEYTAKLDDTIDPAGITPDGHRIAVRHHESVQVWDSVDRSAAPRFTLPHGGWARTAVFVDGGRSLVTGADETAAHVWDMETGSERHRLDHGAAIEGVAVSPDGGRVLTVGNDGKARLWSSETGERLHELVHGCGLRDGRFVDGGRLVATRSEAARDGCEARVIVWRAASGEAVSTMHIAKADDIQFSADGRRMLSRHSRNVDHAEERAFVWDVDTGEQRFGEPFVFADDLRAAEFSGDGRFLVTGAGRRVSVWAVGGRELQAALDTATTACLPAEFRRQNLGESEADARRKHEECERRHGR